MKIIAISLCILVFGCTKSKTIYPVDRSFITVQFHGEEIKFDDLLSQPVTNYYTKDSIEKLIYLFGTKRVDRVNQEQYLEYFIYMVFRLDSTESRYLVSQTDFNVNVYANNHNNTTGYTSIHSKSGLTFDIHPDQVEHIIGSLTGSLFNRDYLLPDKEVKDSLAVLSGHFDLNFDTIKHSP